MRLLLVTAFASILALPTLWSAVLAERFVVHSWQSEDGLPSNNIRALVQSADGLLWVATAEGVVRFDGVRFSSFKGDPDAQLTRQPPKALFALANGDVWIATLRGGLLRWDGSRITAIWAGADDETLLARDVTQIVSDGQSGVFIESGEKIYHAVGSKPPRLIERTPEITAKVRSASLATSQRSVLAMPSDPLELLDSHGRRWMRTADGGLGVSGSPENSESIAPPHLPEGARISALLEDRESNLWVATNGSGLFQVRTRRVKVTDTANGLTDRSVMALMEDRTGVLWAGSKSGGIDRIAQGHVEHFRLGNSESARPVSAICEDQAGVLWVAKENGALFRWDGGGFQAVNHEKPLVRLVHAVIGDAKGHLWFGGRDGVAVWADGHLQQFGSDEGLPPQHVTALAFDRTGVLWIGTANGGLFQGRDGRFVKVATLQGRAVSSLQPGEEGVVWGSTLGAGLFFIKEGHITRFAEPQGLPDARLTCVLDDRAGHLWMGSLGGIFRVAKVDLLRVAKDRGGKVDWLSFDRADGLLSRECTGGFQPAGWRGRDGTLWFPTVNGIASVQPEGLEFNRVAPRVMIEEARARSNEPSPAGAVLEAGPGRSRLEFRFTAPSFSAPEKVRFRTRLKGLEEEWQDTGTQRTVAYEAVPPGDYVFQVMAANNDGVWSKNTASLAVHVLPRFWETLWFRSMAILLLIAAASAIGAIIARARMRGRMLRLEAQTARQRERERIARDLHDDLGASLTEISLLAGLAAEDTVAERRSDSLPVIASKAQELVSTLDEIVWAVNPRHDTVVSFYEYLTASAAELLNTADIALRLNLPDHPPDHAFDADQRHALFNAVREALNNVVKHAVATEVKLDLHVRSDELSVSVSDNGRGLAEDLSDFSEGLRNMRGRMEGIGGTCNIRSDSGGTSVIFSLRLVSR